ncbi:MAG: KEOPS complex subunit Pcc1 [Thermoplasmata archaeon]|jgi:KEOPS complex subunit Pcc1|nr:hypothetical protein [Thermoplasmatales archaeon]PMP74917.1 MAG: hypothetical protein C0180_02955 [Aciduliprofundum sp.]
MNSDAEIRIDTPNAGIICKSIGVEGKRSIPRTEVNIDCSDDNLTIRISASDINALRAAINSYMRWINLVMELLEMV